MSIERFREVRKYTEKLCRNLEIEDYVIQAVEEVSPVKWHLAHTTWFFETFLLKPHLSTYREFHPQFSYLFNSYYNTVGTRTQRFHRGIMSRPTVSEVMAYRKHVEQELEILLSKRVNGEIGKLVELGLHHEQQHQELLLTDLKFNLSFNPLYPAVLDIQEYVQEGEPGWTHIGEGLYEIGHPGAGFSFDNEHGRHQVFLEGFNISKTLVTNEQFMEFIQAGAYGNPLLWHSDGWDWVQKNRIKNVLYWLELAKDHQYYTLDGIK